MLNTILYLSRNQKKALFVVFDFFALIICCWLSFSLRYGDFTAHDFEHWPAYIIAPLVSIPIFITSGLYRAVIRYMGYRALWTIVKAITFALLVWALFTYLVGFESAVPRSVVFIFWFISIVFIGGARMLTRWFILHQLPGGEQKEKLSGERVLIYGAGSSGRQLAEALYHSKEFNTVGYIDDDIRLNGIDLNGVRVHHTDKIDYLIDNLNVESILLALPSVSKAKRKEIVESLSDFHIKVFTIPDLSDLAGGKVSVNDVREIDIADLLGREEVQPQQELLEECIYSKSVLVTGAGGSIGSELCRQIVLQEPTTLILYELSEFALYSIELELRSFNSSATRVVPILGNVLDPALLEKTLKEYKVDTVYHAAAYKHVPLVEANMLSGLRNNILGTWYAAEASLKCNVSHFVLVSTDKAVRPTNVMGASKRFSELILQAITRRDIADNSTHFVMVRFGNVLGSSGSVIPLFKKQILDGGPVTVTHPEITRYFMTIPEAASLVIQAGSMGDSGDVFVLDMGEPVKIKSLAKKMINLAGHSVRDSSNSNGDIEIVYSGLRAGEKLYEELLIGSNVQKTQHKMIMRAFEDMLLWNDLHPILIDLEGCFERFDYEAIREILLGAIHGYKPKDDICDLIYLESN